MHLIEDVRLIGGPLPVLEKMGWRKKMILFLYVVIKAIKKIIQWLIKSIYLTPGSKLELP